MSERLYRSREDRMLAGVAGGLAEMWDADPSLVRIAWALLVLFSGGIALLVYIVMAIVVPEGDALDGMPSSAAPVDVREARRAARSARAATRRDHGNSAGMVIGASLVLIGGLFFVHEWLPDFDPEFLWPFGLIGLGVFVLVLGFRRDPGTGGPGR
jgi:phage shock protein C